MAQKLFASKAVQSIINKYKPLSKEEEIKWTEEYKKTHSDKSAMALLNGISKLFASAINQNESKFLAAVPEAEYDDIFNTMAALFFKFLHEFDPKKSKLNTWVTNNITIQIVKNPLRLMGDKFGRKHGLVNIDTPMGDSGDTIATMLPDTSMDIEDDYEKGGQKAKLIRAIKKLPKDEQEIILNLFKYVTPKKEWQTKTGNINAASIARALGISADRMRTRVEKILNKLKSELKESKFDRFYSLDRLILQYVNPNKANLLYLGYLNPKDMALVAAKLLAITYRSISPRIKLSLKKSFEIIAQLTLLTKKDVINIVSGNSTRISLTKKFTTLKGWETLNDILRAIKDHHDKQ